MTLIEHELISKLNELLEELIVRLKKAKGRASDFKDRVWSHRGKLYLGTYALYGLLDAISVSYSTLKFCCDAYAPSSKEAAELINYALSSPEGIFIVVLESLALISLSIVANVTIIKESKGMRRHFMTVWPYVRDVLKGMKNTYRGFKSAMLVSSHLTGKNLHLFITPLGIMLGILNIFNRVWIRGMRNRRKAMQDKNKELCDKIKATSFDEDHAKNYRLYNEFSAQIQRQNADVRFQAYAVSTISGLIDGMYLFMGIVILAPVSGPLFPMLAAASVLFVAVNVLTRLNEEYNYQKKLKKSALECELALESRVLIHRINKLREVRKTKGDAALLTQAGDDFRRAKENYIRKREEYRIFIRPSYTNALLMGMKDGLSAYGVIASLLFAAATIMLLTSVTVPPAAVISVVAAGIASLVLFTGIAAVRGLIKQRKHYLKEKAEFAEKLSYTNLLDRFEGEIHHHEHEEDELDTAIEEPIYADTPPLDDFQTFFEVCRSAFSGLGKGPKTVDFTLHPMGERDENGDYHESTVMLVLTAVTSVVYAGCMAIRAFHRGYEKKKKEAKPPAPAYVPPDKVEKKVRFIDKAGTPPVAVSKSRYALFGESTKVRASGGLSHSKSFQPNWPGQSMQDAG